MTDSANALAAGLLAHLRARWPAVQGVEGLAPVTTGASQEIWTFSARRPDGLLPLVLRRARQWDVGSQRGSAGMVAEAALLRAAAAGGVPVPRVYGELAREDGLGEGYVMERVEGETAGRKILREPAFAAVRPLLVTQCAAILARVHALPRAALPGLRSGQAAEELRHWRTAYEANEIARPVFALALRWLADHLPAPCSESLVHGDFRNGNLVVAADGVRAVLDWELAHFGDPMEDLGWFCVNAWRFGNVDQPAGGFGSREALFSAYESASGWPVDPGRVKFWEVLGNLKWGVACDAMGLTWRRGSDSSIERLAIGRRAVEVEADLLELIAPEAVT